MTAGALYAILFVAALVPGLPLGWHLFGRRHPAGWVSGALLGYALTMFSVWLGMRTGHTSGRGFVLAWLVVSLAAWATLMLRKSHAGLIELEPWTNPDTLALAAVLLVTLVFVTPAFVKLGSRDAEGNRYYRAYFTADFVWHMALTAEVGKFALPPRDPFMQHRPIHYYWGYFLVPAAISSTGPRPVRDVELALKVNAMACGFLFITAIFLAARAAVPLPAAVALGVTVAFVAPSAEGWARMFQLWREGTPMSVLSQTNIDAVTTWVWNGYRIDGLQRAIWYNPQHSMSGALGLVGLAAAAADGSAATPQAGAITGLALGASVALNPFVGALFSLAYGVSAAIDAFRRKQIYWRLLSSAVAAVPVMAAVAWVIDSRMVSGAGSALTFGWGGPSLHAPLWTLILSLGTVLGLAVAGFVVSAWRGSARRLVPAAVLAGVSLFLMYFVRLSVDEYWVGFRTGQLVLMCCATLGAAFFAWALRVGRALALAVAAGALIVGAPTLVIDAYNAQNLAERSLAPGDFPWTRVVTPAEQDAYQWIRTRTPRRAVVQQEALARERSTWWVVPTFGQRRLAAGLPPFLLDVAEYHERARLVREMYAAPAAEDAWYRARSMRINYIYVDDLERKLYGGLLDKFEDHQFFMRPFANDAVTIYQVR